MIHGDDWRQGPDRTLRTNAIKALSKYGGKLIEVPYTKGISSEALIMYFFNFEFKSPLLELTIAAAFFTIAIE